MTTGLVNVKPEYGVTTFKEITNRNIQVVFKDIPTLIWMVPPPHPPLPQIPPKLTNCDVSSVNRGSPGNRQTLGRSSRLKQEQEQERSRSISRRRSRRR